MFRLQHVAYMSKLLLLCQPDRRRRLSQAASEQAYYVQHSTLLSLLSVTSQTLRSSHTLPVAAARLAHLAGFRLNLDHALYFLDSHD
eukprot:scaffold120524_cov69-Phaeocystis_antarctica.AAC.4